ncbi:hypothetical protein SLA2020_262220 [Shorea laevis]
MGRIGSGLLDPKDLEEDAGGPDVGVFFRERGLLPDHLGEDVSNGPDVDPSGVMRRSEQNLGRPIPESDDLLGVALERNGEGVAEAQIGESAGDA